MSLGPRESKKARLKISLKQGVCGHVSKETFSLIFRAFIHILIHILSFRTLV